MTKEVTITRIERNTNSHDIYIYFSRPMEASRNNWYVIQRRSDNWLFSMDHCEIEWTDFEECPQMYVLGSGISSKQNNSVMQELVGMSPEVIDGVIERVYKLPINTPHANRVTRDFKEKGLPLPYGYDPS